MNETTKTAIESIKFPVRYNHVVEQLFDADDVFICDIGPGDRRDDEMQRLGEFLVDTINAHQENEELRRRLGVAVEALKVYGDESKWFPLPGTSGLNRFFNHDGSSVHGHVLAKAALGRVDGGTSNEKTKL